MRTRAAIHSVGLSYGDSQDSGDVGATDKSLDTLRAI